MARVLAKESLYEYPRLREDVFSILSDLDDGMIQKGSTVLVKPNFLAAAPPEKAVTTHPLVIRAAAEYALEKGARVTVGDSNPLGSFEKVIAKCGAKEALRGLPVTLEELTESRAIAASGKFATLELSARALDADVIISLPKLKTHAQMTLTLAVKNFFGCVVGMRKPEWHFRVGENKDLFAELLVTVYKSLGPSLSLMDGILAMEGDGPGTGGRPRHLGLLMGSTDAVSLDMAVCRMLGIDPLSLPTNKAAQRLGARGEPEIMGELKRVEGFVIPETGDLLFGPGFARDFLRRHITSRPQSTDEVCKLCNECLEVCPADAITNPGRRLDFDYDKCIRCYCCLEVCPHGAMEKRDTFLKKIVKRYAGARKG
jgi:uncharacterized protein (DUF362 family)/Pyruvate/2-oxoacid:ferredoxin oxidoreductase delta subunit